MDGMEKHSSEGVLERHGCPGSPRYAAWKPPSAGRPCSSTRASGERSRADSASSPPSTPAAAPSAVTSAVYGTGGHAWKKPAAETASLGACAHVAQMISL